MNTLGIDTDRVGLGLPFVPFTFDTVAFTNLARDNGYELTWDQVDDIWEAYKLGRSSGELTSKGNTAEVASYLKSKVWYRPETIKAWLNTADAAASSWWGFGGYFVDFGGPAGPIKGAVDTAKSVVKGVADSAGQVLKAAGKGLSDGLGVPGWIMGLVVVLVVGVVVVLYYKTVSVKSSFA